MKTTLPKTKKRKPAGRTASLRSGTLVRLLRTEYIETAYAQHAAGPGWANAPLWIVITDGATGKTRKACLQPEEQTPEMRTLYSFSALAHASMLSAVERVSVKPNGRDEPRGGQTHE